MRILAILLLLTLQACSERSTHETYTIYRTGVLFSDETFDVVHVYGFMDNESVAEQLTDFLNASEPNVYNYRLAER